MDKNFFIHLTTALYRVTELFPEEEPLKSAIRERANEILADLILISQDLITHQKGKEASQRVLENVAVLRGYFEIASSQGWVDEKNFLVLQINYSRIEEDLARKKNAHSAPEKSEEEENDIGGERKKKILEVLQGQKRIKVTELVKKLPKVSTRTLRRDLEFLVKQKLVTKVGDRATASYKLVKIT